MNQILITILTPIVIGLIRQYGPAAMEKVPGWMLPIVAAILGTAGGAVSGVDLTSAAVAGLAGTGLHQVKKQFEKSDGLGGSATFRFLPWLLLPLLLFAPALVHAAGRATLAWDANTEADLAGYKVYVGTASGQYGPPVDVGLTATPTAPTHDVEPLEDGTYFFAVTAYDASGNESGFSNEVSKSIDSTPPAPPSGLKVLIQKIIAWLQSLLGQG